MINQKLMLRDTTNKQGEVLYLILSAFIGRVSILTNYDQRKALEMRLCLKSSPIVISSRESITLFCTSQISSWVDMKILLWMSALILQGKPAGKLQIQKSMMKCSEIVSIFYENLVFKSVTLSLKGPLHLINGYRHPRHCIFMRSEISSVSKGAIFLYKEQKGKK